MERAEGGPAARALRVVGRFLLGVPWPLAVLLVLGWGFVIWDLSSHAVPLPTAQSLGWEFLSNLAHAPLFGILTLFTAGILLRERGGGWPRAQAGRSALVALAVLGYGVLDEWHQSRIPGRDSSAIDVMTDLTSALCVLWIVHTLGGEPSERRLAGRLALGVGLCAASAALATLF
jgi:VanZ family protein